MPIRSIFGGYSVLSTGMTAGLKTALAGSITNRLRSLFDRAVGVATTYPEFDMLHPGLVHQILNELDAISDAITSTATA